MIQGIRSRGEARAGNARQDQDLQAPHGDGIQKSRYVRTIATILMITNHSPIPRQTAAVQRNAPGHQILEAGSTTPGRVARMYDVLLDAWFSLMLIFYQPD